MTYRAKRNLRVAVMGTVVGVGAVVNAGTFNDNADGLWNALDTWAEGAAPTTVDDVINIDQYTVEISHPGAINQPITMFTGGTINLSGTGRLEFTGTYDYATQPLKLYMNGGTFFTGSSNDFSAGAAGTYNFVSIEGESTIQSGGADIAAIGDSTADIQLTGGGRLIKTGAGGLSLNASSEDATNPSNFTGIVDIRQGTLYVGNVNILPNASEVILNGGTLETTFAGTTVASTPRVKKLTGSGTIRWSTSGYARDLQIAPGGSLSPGTATTPGTITRSTSTTRNDLDFKTDAASGNSKLELDVFGATQADADQVIWKDDATDRTSVIDAAGGDLVVRLFTPTENLAAGRWVLVDADEFGNAASGSSGSTAETQTQDDQGTYHFKSVSFLKLDGTALDLFNGTAGDGGWANLMIDYAGTTGMSDRQVVLTGDYFAPAQMPEPSSLGVLALGVGVLLRRRRARA